MLSIDSDFTFWRFSMDTIPTELLELQARFDSWRAERKYVRQPLPEELRRAVLELARRFPASLIRRVLKIDTARLKKQSPGKGFSRVTTRNSSSPAFFKLPDLTPETTVLRPPQTSCDCRLQLERPDGARLIFTLPALDAAAINQLCADFLRA
jgi:hypothetical protein